MTGNRIKEVREKMGISQQELARRVRMAPQNLSNIERGRLAAWPKIIRKLARALKTTSEELFPEGDKNG